MLLAQIRLAADRKLECRAGILRLIGGDSLEPGSLKIEEEQDQQETGSQGLPEDTDGAQEPEDEPTSAPDERSKALLEPYRKMLKFGVPRVTVEARMRKDGINPNALDGPLPEGTIYIEQAPKSVTSDAPAVRTSRRKWHWKQVPEADRAPPPPTGSIWTKVSEKDAHRRLSAPSQAHIKELFVREIDSIVESAKNEPVVLAAPLVKLTSTVNRPCRPRAVQLLTGNKGINLEFIVKHIKRPFTDVAKDVNILTAMYLQDTDIKTILAMWPSIAEQIALDEYSEEVESLGLCEQFLVTVRKVPMAKEKLQCLLLKLERSSRVESLKQTVLLVTRALNQLCSSTKFTKVIRLLRDFGNLANEESAVNFKARFSLEALASLANTKAFDGSSTVLDGFWDVLRMEENGELLNFYDEINLVLQCKSVPVGALASEMKQLHEGYLLARSIAQASASSGDDPDEAAELAHQAFTQFAEEVDDDLRGVQTYFDDLELSKKRFESWFEENVHRSLEQHLKAIIHFALEVKARNAASN